MRDMCPPRQVYVRIQRNAMDHITLPITLLAYVPIGKGQIQNPAKSTLWKPTQAKTMPSIREKMQKMKYLTLLCKKSALFCVQFQLAVHNSKSVTALHPESV